MCFEGSAAGYSAVLEAYTLMLDVGPGDAVELKPLDVKLQESFAGAVDRCGTLNPRSVLSFVADVGSWKQTILIINNLNDSDMEFQPNGI